MTQAVETELVLQSQLRELFLTLKEGLIKGELNSNLVDKIEIVSEKIKQNRQKLLSLKLTEEDKKRINSLVLENQALYRLVSDLLRFNSELVDILKEVPYKGLETYSVVQGKLKVD